MGKAPGKGLPFPHAGRLVCLWFGNASYLACLFTQISTSWLRDSSGICPVNQGEIPDGSRRKQRADPKR
ncbi:hypothetical protein DDR33_02525 [Pararcticibacter amylolyticus]|uniref:Uncharacterized protein n=1 Tax=Pararcticibacter amylolyticus TaxID=2173175 RepID=A0A2U2PKI3_9SPHI|nr:hypothetical protein DDR33_02525 [Pararcticibacter amylolyticus]